MSELFPTAASEDPEPTLCAIPENARKFERPTVPLSVTHAGFYPIIADKTTSRVHKIREVTKLTFQAYLRPLESGGGVPTDEKIDELIELALFLRARGAIDDSVKIDLDMLDDAVSGVRNFSPVSIAEDLERLEAQYDIPEISTLVTKLWTFDMMGDPSDMPTDFQAQRELCRKQKAKASGRRTFIGASFFS